MTIHPSAIIDPTATIDQGVEIGPYTVIGPYCQVGENTKIASHVVLEGYTRIGKHCQVASGAVLGGLPQDHGFGGETSWVDIGDYSVIREYVTINRGTGEGTSTKLGEHCMIMAYSHVAHNCQLGNHVILANNVQMAGYVELGDHVFMSGVCVVHQFVKIGRLTIVSGLSGTRQDLPPFAMTEGRPQAVVVGINKVGLKRAGVSLESRTRIKKAFHLLFLSKLSMQEALAAVAVEVDADPYVDELVAFVKNSKRGIHRPSDVVETEERSPVLTSTLTSTP